MDYCFPCRRALNGAVTCPECGAYDSAMPPTSDRGGIAPEVDTAVLEVLFSEGPASFESPAPPSSPATSADVPAARRHCPPRLKKYRAGTLAAATFAMLGGLAAASLLPQHSAGAPRAATSPEQASPDEPHVPVTESARASLPERPATRPARGSVRDRNSGAPRRPRAATTPRESSTSRTPAAPTGPPMKAKPTPRPSSGHPSHSASPTATPSASPTGSISTSPTSSPTPSTTGVPVNDVHGESEPLLPDRRRSGAVGGTITGR